MDKGKGFSWAACVYFTLAVVMIGIGYVNFVSPPKTAWANTEKGLLVVFTIGVRVQGIGSDFPGSLSNVRAFSLPVRNLVLSDRASAYYRHYPAWAS
jgi:hypothetical protein